MRRRTVFAASALGSAGLALSAGCRPPAQVQPQPTSPPSSSPTVAPVSTALKPVKGGTLTLAMARDVTTLDPARLGDVYGEIVLNLVADTLFELDAAGNVVGRLVEKTDTPQPNVYVFTLRQGLRFHDGAALDAAAVRWNVQRHVADPQSRPHSDLKDITGLDVVDRRTLRVTLRGPNAILPFKLSGTAGYVLNPAAVQKLGAGLTRSLADAGSGPFRFAEWRPGLQVVLERNPAFWKRDEDGASLPYVERIVLKPVLDEHARAAGVQAGTLDGLIGGVPGQNLVSLTSDPRLDVAQLPGLGFAYVALNTTRAPFDRAEVRRAFSLALDRDQIVQQIYGGGLPLATPVPESLPWAYYRDPHAFRRRDLDAARQELAAGGRPDGFRFTLQLAGGSPQLQALVALMKAQVQEIGLDLQPQEVDFSTALANGAAGNYEALNLNWSGDADPDTLYSLFYTRASNNYTRYSNPTVDRLLDDARATSDRAKRADFYRQVQRILLEDHPAAIYYNTPKIVISRKGVQRYPRSHNGYWGMRDLERTWKT
ncbi:MAG TPA: ABC transporter substrate-binding protein [Chloroflexota bacterium]|nr:ABC transporter substrate-binding protein [Chloroflexota bacterium]